MLRHQQQTPSSDTATYASLGSNLGLLTVKSAAEDAAPRRDLHVVFVLDRSGSMAGTFRRLVLPACAGYLDAVAPRRASAVYFNDRAKIDAHVTAATLRASPRDGTYTTRIDRGVEAAVDFVIGLTRSSDSIQPPVYQFVFMTDGANDQDCVGSALERAIATSGSRLRAAGCDAFVSVINVGVEADTRAGMWTHAALSTMSVSTEGAFAVARTGTDVPQVVSTLAAHTLAVVGSGVGCLRTIDLGDSLADPDGAPAPAIIALAGTAGQRSMRVAGASACMFVGGDSAPKTITIIRGAMSERIPVVVIDALDADTATNAIETVDDHVRRVAMEQVSGGVGLDVSAAVSFLRGVLDAIDASGALAKDMGTRVGAARTPAQRVRLMRRTVAASRERVASIRDTHLISRAAPADMAAYVDSMGAVKYGVAALKRAAAADMTPYDAASIMRALAQARPATAQPDGGDGVDDDAPCSFFSQATATELWADATSPAQHEAVRAAAGGHIDEHVVLAGFGMLGYGLHTRRSAAAYVEPWHLGVRYVSCDPVATNDTISALAAKYPLEDASRKRITDVVVVREPARPAVYDAYADTPLATAYLAVVHARNPSVGLPSQRTALPALAMMRAAAQVVGHHGPNQATGAHARVLLRLVLHTAHVMTDNGRAAHVASTLAAPGKAGCGSVLTTKAHVHRVAQAAAYMVCRPESAALVEDPVRLAAAARAMLAQAVAEAHAATSPSPSRSLAATILSSSPCPNAPPTDPSLANNVHDHNNDNGGNDDRDNNDNEGSDDDDDTPQDDNVTAASVDDDDAQGASDDAKDAQAETLIEVLDAVLATGEHPVPLADDIDEPAAVECATDYDPNAVSMAGLGCLRWLSRKAAVIDALVGVALLRAFYGAVVPMAKDAVARGLIQPIGNGGTVYDAVTAFVASSPGAEEMCATALSDALKDPLATDVDAFIAHYWSLAPDSTDNNATAVCAAALAAQALQRPTASKRCANADTVVAQLEPLDDLAACIAYLGATASTVRRQRYRRLLTAKNARLREAERLRREAAAEAERQRVLQAWRSAHVGMPVVFTADQIEAHNRAHPDDPWSVSMHPTTRKPSALLNDRCCFASCPDYMRRLDNAGLWEHLAPGQCTPAFHVAARQAFAGVRRHYGTGRSRAEILADFTAAVRAALAGRDIVEYGPDMYDITLGQFERAHGLAVQSSLA
jgi:hypothetical protein